MRKRLAAVIPFLIALVAGLLLAASAGPAAAATPCWKKVLDDWSNGRAIGAYPLHCYRDAIRNMPEDLRDYSSAADEISAALQAQISQRDTRSPQIGGGSTGNGGNGNGSGQVGPEGNKPTPSAYRRAIDNLGTSNADSLPIPLLVLAALGAALLLTAAGMTGAKRIRARRRPRPPT